MPHSDEQVYARLCGLMQNYMRAYAHAQEPPAGDPRGVVEQDDALDAVMQLAAVLDEFTQSGAIPTDRGMHATACLMVLREYVRLAPPSEEDGRDLLAEDLARIVGAHREAREQYVPPAG
ncbi:hypothetical protein ACI780_20870 [Geodermatophilus sp. SYSU D00814]